MIQDYPSQQFHQWDIVKARVRESDRDEHYLVIVSSEDTCASPNAPYLNVLFCSSRRPGRELRAGQVILNGSDGLDHQTVVDCSYFHSIPKAKLKMTDARITPKRRALLKSTTIAAFRLIGP